MHTRALCHIEVVETLIAVNPKTETGSNICTFTHRLSDELSLAQVQPPFKVPTLSHSVIIDTGRFLPVSMV